MQDNNRGRKAFVVDHESPGVGDKEVGREASGVAENPQGSAREWEGELSHHRAMTPPE